MSDVNGFRDALAAGTPIRRELDDNGHVIALTWDDPDHDVAADFRAARAAAEAAYDAEVLCNRTDPAAAFTDRPWTLDIDHLRAVVLACDIPAPGPRANLSWLTDVPLLVPPMLPPEPEWSPRDVGARIVLPVMADPSFAVIVTGV